MIILFSCITAVIALSIACVWAIGLKKIPIKDARVREITGFIRTSAKA